LKHGAGRFASAWPELIIACDVRGRGLLQTDGRPVDVTTGLRIVAFFLLYSRGRKDVKKVVNSKG